QTSYDDSELREKIQTLEDREDHDTIYTAGAGLRLIGTEFSVDEASLPQGPKGDVGETGPQGETGLAGADGKSAYRIWLEHGGRGTEEDFLNSLKATSSSPNRPPTGFSLDRSTTPYQFCFDNGCRLTLGNVDSRAYIRQDITDMFAGNLSEYRVAMSIIRTANGSVGIDNWQSANSIARFWNDAEVIHPVNDASGFNFDNAYYNINDTSGPSRRNQSRLIKCYFELGVFTESDIQSFGAIKI
ncbi:collagen-like triple helix repeat-containing protein, partial [Streptococcus suis]|uniref:collagen-like triple helix repeat-containing protein n=1 Tax=Streptococcus suis TaxID=1307 RepID=UPI002429E278|nr:collagen-like protein [Streptococcus suis]